MLVSVTIALVTSVTGVASRTASERQCGDGERLDTIGENIIEVFIILPRPLVLLSPLSLLNPYTMSGFAPHSADDVAIATIRTLAADVVGKANSGHPGTRTHRVSGTRGI